MEVNGFINALIVMSAIVFILTLRKFIDILPSLIGCLLRWKESLNLEYSIKLSNNRNLIFLLSILPFSLAVSVYRLYSPDYLSDSGQTVHLLVCVGVISVYTLLKFILSHRFRIYRMDKNTGNASFKIFYNFFILATILTISSIGILNVLNVPSGIISSVILYEIFAIYLIFIIRKAQIFIRYCSILPTILYLCALEILPTGLLVVSAVIL